MNKYVERLYNGISKKSYLCTYAWYVSYTGCYIKCGKRTWNGTFHHGGTYMFKPFDFTFQKSDS